MDNLDNLSIKLILKFYNLSDDEETTTWKIMRELYPIGHDKEHMRIKLKLKKLNELGIFLIEKNSQSHYILIRDNIQIKEIPFPDKVRRVLFVKICEKWSAYETC